MAQGERSMFDINKTRIGVIGLGYVGLPLEVEPHELKEATQLTITADLGALESCNFYIVTVPTPIDRHRRPDLTPLISASHPVGNTIKKGDVVVYESTVYPGSTEEDCVPIIERESGLKFNTDFFVGYSPERITPGDKAHRVTNIVKNISGSTPEVADYVDAVYRRVIKVGTHKASSIRVAEAAKVIENTQRDVNIALINELALLFHRMGIDTLEVLEAAGSKCNFLPFRPGLVGGHCIGVDPYYLTHKAQEIGYNPEIILAGRRINDNMGAHVAERVVKMMTRRRIAVVDAKVLMLGLTFKENCTDIRNTRAIDIIKELEGFHAQLDVYEPWANADEDKHEYNDIKLIPELKPGEYDAVIIAVAHRQFREMGVQALRALCT